MSTEQSPVMSEHIQTFIQTVHSNHYVGAGISLIMIGFAVTMKVMIAILPQISEVHIPPVILESAQLIAYLGAITVSTITVYGWIKGFNSPKNKKSTDTDGK